jgi:hypothetical protein
LLQDAGSISIDLQDLTVDFSQLIGVIVLLVVRMAYLLLEMTVDRTENLDVFISFTRLPFELRIIQANGNQGDVVS